MSLILERNHWPVSDPCGRSGLNQLSDVENPAGWLYVREKELFTPDVIEIFDSDENNSKYTFINSPHYQKT